MNMVNISIGSAAIVVVLGMAVVFLGLILLMFNERPMSPSDGNIGLSLSFIVRSDGIFLCELFQILTCTGNRFLLSLLLQSAHEDR